jgi:hypothetical protein
LEARASPSIEGCQAAPEVQCLVAISCIT